MRVWHDLAVGQMADNSFGYSETLLSRHLCLFSSVFVCVDDSETGQQSERERDGVIESIWRETDPHSILAFRL